jgi:hypothetical protein
LLAYTLLELDEGISLFVMHLPLKASRVCVITRKMLTHALFLLLVSSLFAVTLRSLLPMRRHLPFVPLRGTILSLGLSIHSTCSQGKYEEARPMHEEALKIRRKALGDDHENVASSLNNLANLLSSQVRSSLEHLLSSFLLCSFLFTPNRLSVTIHLD